MGILYIYDFLNYSIGLNGHPQIWFIEIQIFFPSILSKRYEYIGTNIEYILYIHAIIDGSKL